jgi:L-lysine 2,3-aminomutase
LIETSATIYTKIFTYSPAIVTLIPNQQPTHQTRWQKELASAFTNLDELCDYLKLSTEQSTLLNEFKSFPLKVPLSFVERMEPGNPTDPLLLQILPFQAELQTVSGFTQDPVGDITSIATTGVLHKYHGRVLLIMTGACAINCRYCFRRNFPYQDVQLTPRYQQQALDYIATNTDISEVILSGGDPLLLKDEKIAELMHALNKFDHVQRVRIHTRLPVVLPSRITQNLLEALGQWQKPLTVVIHSNHANELNQSVAKACGLLLEQKILLLNQSVLLKNINDSVDALSALSTRLIELSVLPYYLHLLDKAQGTSHFNVTEQQAQFLIKRLRKLLPGYLVPRLVKEEAGKSGKTLIL